MRSSTGFCSEIPPTQVAPDDCQNGGVPSKNGNGTCICQPHYSGSKCEKIQCLNLGTIIGTSCSCLAGFTGQYCEITSCYEQNVNVDWSPNDRSLTFLIHDSIATRSSLKTISENAARVLDNTVQHHPEWLTYFNVMRFNDTDFETVVSSTKEMDCLLGIQNMYKRNTQNSEVSCANLALMPALVSALNDKQITQRGIFFIFINGYINVDFSLLPVIYNILETSKVELNIVLLTGSPCGQSMDDYATKMLMNLAQFSDGQFIMAMPSNAGKVVHTIPTLYRSSYVYENLVENCTKEQTFYFPVDSQTQSVTSYIVGDLLEEPIYYYPVEEPTPEHPGPWERHYPHNLWNDVGMGSRMDQLIQPCDEGWQLYGNRCWKFGLAFRSWTDARDACHAEGATLPTVYDVSEQAFIDQQVQDMDVWLGLNDMENKGVWMWDQISIPISLESTGYKNWAPPDQPSSAMENQCVYDSHNGQIGWVNDRCGTVRAYICTKHAYDADFEPTIDGKINVLPRGIWKATVKTYEGACYIQVFSQSGIQLYREYTTAIHDDSGYPGPIALAAANRIIAHASNQKWAGQGVEGHLQYAHMYTANLAIIQAQRFDKRDEYSCSYEYVSNSFKCPDVTFLTMSTGVDRYGYLYQRIHQVMCLTGPASEDDCLHGSILVNGECVCPPHYTGMFCEKPLCINGYLSASKTTCVCPPLANYMGLFCQTPLCRRQGDIELPNPGNRTFIVAVDGCPKDAMADVIAKLDTVLNAVIAESDKKVGWFTHFTGIVFRDLNTTDVTSLVIESDTAADFVTQITAEARKPCAPMSTARATIHGIATVLQSDSILSRSEMFVITSGNAQDYTSETTAMDTIGRKRVFVNFLIVGDQTAPGGVAETDPSVETYYNIASMSGGNYYQVPGTADGLQKFWVSLMSTMYDTYFISRVTRVNCSGLVEYIQVGANTSDIMIDAFAKIQPKVTLLDADGNNAPFTEIATSNTNHIIFAGSVGEPGLWTVRIDQGVSDAGYCTVGVRGQSTMVVQIGFTQDIADDGGYHSNSVALYPVFGSGNAVTATTTAGTLLFAQIFSADERRLLWASPLIIRSRCKWPYISTNVFTCPEPYFVVAIDGEDFAGHPFRRMIHIHCIGTYVTRPTAFVPTTLSQATTTPASTTPYPTCDPSEPKFDVFLIFDGSNGMAQDEFNRVIDAMMGIPDHVTIGPQNTRFIVASYAAQVQLLEGNTFDNITDAASFRAALLHTEMFGRSGATGNNILGVLESIDQNQFRVGDGIERAIILFSSVGWDKGNSGQGFGDPTEKAKQFQRGSINIIVVAYGPNANLEQLGKISQCVHPAANNAELEAFLPYLTSIFCRKDQAC